MNSAEAGVLKISKIIRNYQPGYLYENIKTHKPGLTP